MRARVVYESMFGNTEQIAKAIAEGLAETVEAVTCEVSRQPTAAHVELLVVGGPTHAFSMSRRSTREDAAGRSQVPLVSVSGIREWLGGLDRLPPGLEVATFDTRIRRPRLPGSAANAAMRALRRLGGHSLMSPESFWVDGTTGPPLDGELERARSWGGELARRLASSTDAGVAPASGAGPKSRR